MLSPINLLINKVKGNALKLFPNDGTRIDNLTEANVKLNNFTVISAYNNQYKTDLTDGSNVNAVNQSWISAKLFNLSGLQNSFALGGLTQLLSTNVEGGTLSAGPNAPNIYIALDDVSDDATVISKVSALIGYTLEVADYKLTRPLSDIQKYISIVIKNPYLIGTLYVYEVTEGEIKQLPGVNIPPPTYAATNKTEQLSLMELLLLNIYPNGWTVEVTQEEFNALYAAARSPYILYDLFALRKDTGSVYYDSGNGCYFPSVKMGYTGLSYTVFDIDNSDFIDWVDLNSTDDLANVTTAGFYRIKSQTVYRYWLMVDDFTTVNKDLFNVYSKKLWMSQSELGYSVNGSGDYGTPQPSLKYRGAYNMENILMHGFSIRIRRIGE